MDLLGILIAILVAAVTWWLCIALGLPTIVALIAAILVLFAAWGSVVGSRL